MRQVRRLNFSFNMLKKAFVVIAAVYALITAPPIWAASTCEPHLRTRVSYAFTHWFEDPTAATVAEPPADKLIRAGAKGLAQGGVQPLAGQGPPESWTYDGLFSQDGRYDRSFAGVYHDLGIRYIRGHISEILRRKRAVGLSTHVCDLMGSGFFLDHPELADSVTGLRWGPYRVEKLPVNFDRTKLPTEILGDIINPQTWDKLDESMHQRNIPSMDLITMRPVAGWTKAPWSRPPVNQLYALQFIIGQALKRLSPEGHFYFEINVGEIRGVLHETPQMQELIKEINQNTPYKLVLHSAVSIVGTTLGLQGALIPKTYFGEIH